MDLTINFGYLSESKTYPARYGSGSLKNTALLIFGILFGFLLLYKPFGVYEPELKFPYALICFFHALSPSLIFYSYFSCLNLLTGKKIIARGWTLFLECMHLSVVALLVGIASFLMRDAIYNNPYNWSYRYLWEEIRNCYLAGSLLYVVFLSNIEFKRKPEVRNDPVIAGQQVQIATQVRQDDFSLQPEDLLYAKADGNYVTLTYLNDKTVTGQLKRISLAQLEAQLSNFSFVFRCHRAYLVNLKHINKVAGNSQGYILTFNHGAGSVPVSRARLADFDKRYNEICAEKQLK